MIQTPLWAWAAFNGFVLSMLALDLGVFNKRAHAIHVKEALGWSAFWIGLALAFNALIFYSEGHEAGMNFLAGYLIEKSLSVDNLFVFLLIFTYFKVPAAYQHRVLFWGIVGALVMRAIFIGAGIAILHRFHWVMYVFGAFLVYTGFQLAVEQDKEVHPEKNPVLKLFRKWMPVTKDYIGGKFFVVQEGRKFATPLAVVLIVIETTDIIFAVDSIPAILAVSRDPFIVYTSNVFAILGLRALYFALSGMMEIFHHLHYGLAVILIFIGIKMLLSEVYPIPIAAALGVIGSLLALSVAASLLFPKKPSLES